MKKGRPSKTAEFVTTAKALEPYLAEKSILHDPYAKYFTSPLILFLASYPIFKQPIKFLIRHRLSGMYYCLSRAKFIGDYLKTCTQNNDIKQIVILGAGYDTSSLRHNDLDDSFHFFELDLPASQQKKLKLLKKHALSPHKNTHYIQHDLTQMDLRQSLLSNNFDFNSPSLFIASGLSMYLSQEDITNILQTVSRFTNNKAYLILDIYSSVLDEMIDTIKSPPVDQRNKKIGEPFLWTPTREEAEQLFASSKFNNIKRYSCHQFEDLYYKDCDNVSISPYYTLFTACYNKEF